ncbi:MAG TPA: radical SAM protein [Candidatus Polarisedimenticolia bacterium]|nr:radical SAM protein [Candidatus Polarisedimenticolia bacterium]
MTRLVAEDRDDLDGVRGLSKPARDALLQGSRTSRLEVLDRRRSAVDPFVKYLFRSAGETFEAVRIPLLQPRWSVCVSSQAGCALACAFCETGRLGFTRDLEAWEIVEQVLTVRREGPERPVTSVVFQGQGEPFQNYDQVIQAARILQHPCGGRIRGRNITISTVGILPMIERYTAEEHPFRLILSLTSAFDDRRAGLVPSGRRYGVAALAAAMRRHAAKAGDRVNLAWVLMSGVNTGEDEAEELARLFRGAAVRLSIIDVNDPTGTFPRAGDAERGAFLTALGRRGIGFVRRYSGGPDIHAACGMLASSARGGREASGAVEWPLIQQ